MISSSRDLLRSYRKVYFRTGWPGATIDYLRTAGTLQSRNYPGSQQLVQQTIISPAPSYERQRAHSTYSNVAFNRIALMKMWNCRPHPVAHFLFAGIKGAATSARGDPQWLLPICCPAPAPVCPFPDRPSLPPAARSNAPDDGRTRQPLGTLCGSGAA